MSTLYIIATPIGNLEDITLRALRILKDVEVIFAEDTRVTKKLLDHYDIKTRIESLNARTEASKVDKVISLLQEGNNVAYVSDAGTPTVSDPGSQLVASVREVLPEVSIIPLPGASALTSALSVSGLSASEFLFLGFLPHKKGRETLFQEIVESKRTVVLYESPHRIMKTLLRLDELLDEKRKVVIARELTKMYEEVVSGTAQEVLQYFLENTEKQKGEFVVLVGGA